MIEVLKSIRKPLYIRARTLEMLRLMEPALEVKAVDKSIQSFPLRRLRQVTLIGQTDVNISVLFKITARGIPVNMFSASGKQTSRLLPVTPSATNVEDSLEAIFIYKKLYLIAEQLIENFERHASSTLPVKNAQNSPPQVFLDGLLARAIKAKNKKVKRHCEQWFEGLIDNQISILLNEIGVGLSGPLFDFLRMALLRISNPWKVYFVFHMLVIQQQAPCAYSVSIHFKNIEPETELLMKRFLYRLQTICEQPALCQKMLNI